MNYMDDICLSVIFLLFTIMAYLFYIAHSKNVEKEENKLVLCFALFSVMYLILNKHWIYNASVAINMASIAIIIAYIRKCPCEALLLSIFYIFIISNNYSYNLLFIYLQLIIYLVLYFYKKRHDLNEYIYVSLCYISKIIIALSIYNEKDIVLIIITIFFITLLIVLILKKGDSLLKYHMAYKELIQEKQIRISLFKISHEIKNPLAVCKGYFDMLDIENHDQCKKYVPIIKKEVNHALLILNDFSDLSKIKIEKDLIDVSMIVEEIINNLKELLDKEEIKIIFNNDDDFYIEGDYRRLMQVFINVIKNSIEALDDRKNKIIEINIEEKNDNVVITFLDNGIGMSEEVLNEFDNPFFTTKINGTGLGTTLSKEIVKSHDGKIEYNSKLNRGTIVIITIPKIATSFY